MMPVALILGIGGQDGSYLADILLERGYEVHGLYRRSSVNNLQRIEHIQDRITLHQGDITDTLSIIHILETVKPNEVYNEADQDDVGWSYATAGYSYDVTAGAVGRMLEAVCMTDRSIRFFQPLSATIFGNSDRLPQNELTLFHPGSPYACAKVAAYYMVQYYREVQGLFVCAAILYNHDSPRRGKGYLLQKISRAAVKIAKGHQDSLLLGNLDLQVDIGYAKEYMEAACSMMQLSVPDDFVISTNRTYDIQSLVENAFQCAGVCADVDSLVKLDPKFYRPGSPLVLHGDSTKARKRFGFNPECDALSVTRMLVRHLQCE